MPSSGFPLSKTIRADQQKIRADPAPWGCQIIIPRRNPGDFVIIHAAGAPECLQIRQHCHGLPQIKTFGKSGKKVSKLKYTAVLFQDFPFPVISVMV